MGVCSKKKKKREMGVWFWVIDDEMQNDDDLKLNIMAAEYIYMIRMVLSNHKIETHKYNKRAATHAV